MNTGNVRPARTLLAVTGFTIAGLVLRSLSINTRGLWLDEAITVSQASHPVLEVIKTLASGVHPPLYHVLIHYWIGLFGASEVAVRSFSVVVGTAAIPLAYWAGMRLYDHRTGLVACALVALSPFQIWYSQEARMYELLFLAGLMSTAFFVLAVRENRFRHWLGYVVFTLVGVMTHYFFLFALAGQIGYYIFGELVPGETTARRERRSRTRWFKPWGLLRDVETFGPWLVCVLLVGLVLFVWLINSVFAPHAGGPNALVTSVSGSGLGYGQEPPHLALRFNDVAGVIVQMMLGFHSFGAMATFVAMWPLLIYLGFVSMHLIRPMASRSWALVVVGVGGMFVILAIGQWQGQILASRYFTGVAGGLWLLAARLIAGLEPRTLRIVITGLVALALVAWTDQSFNPRNSMRYDNRETLRLAAKSWEPGDVLVYVPFYLDPITAYYLPASVPAYGFPQWGAFGQLRSSQAQMGQDLARIVGPSGRVWVFLSFQNVPTLRANGYAVRYWLKHHGFKVALDRPMNQTELLRFDGPPAGFLLPKSSVTPTLTLPSKAATTPSPGGKP